MWCPMFWIRQSFCCPTKNAFFISIWFVYFCSERLDSERETLFCDQQINESEKLILLCLQRVITFGKSNAFLVVSQRRFGRHIKKRSHIWRSNKLISNFVFSSKHLNSQFYPFVRLALNQSNDQIISELTRYSLIWLSMKLNYPFISEVKQ